MTCYVKIVSLCLIRLPKWLYCAVNTTPAANLGFNLALTGAGLWSRNPNSIDRKLLARCSSFNPSVDLNLSVVDPYLGTRFLTPTTSDPFQIDGSRHKITIWSTHDSIQNMERSGTNEYRFRDWGIFSGDQLSIDRLSSQLLIRNWRRSLNIA